MIDFAVTGDDRVITMLRASVPRITNNVRESMGRIVLRLTRYVKESKLSGQVLKNRTGTLRRKINGRVTEDSTGITGSSGVKLSYAAAHEYGFDGTVSVKAHLRMVRVAFGKALASPVQAQVGAFSRHMRLPERSFLRSSLRDLRPEIFADLDKAVSGAVRTL
jgi:phage gpG-like protein